MNVNRGYARYGLNQYTAAGPASFCYDDNGNLIADGSRVYVYDAENRLVEARAATQSACPTASSGYGGAITASLAYDAMGRLYQTSVNGSGITQFLYDGDELVAEYNGSGTLLRRYIHGANVDDPLVWYEGAAVSAANRRFLYADWQGSIIAVSDNAAAPVIVNRYDEYGIPGAANAGRFQYTGQAWIPELGMYYYKARIYSPTLGRFLQTDPIGYKDQINLYAYVGNSPVNRRDPTGAIINDSSQGDAPWSKPWMGCKPCLGGNHRRQDNVNSDAQHRSVGSRATRAAPRLPGPVAHPCPSPARSWAEMFPSPPQVVINQEDMITASQGTRSWPAHSQLEYQTAHCSSALRMWRPRQVEQLKSFTFPQMPPLRMYPLLLRSSSHWLRRRLSK